MDIQATLNAMADLQRSTRSQYHVTLGALVELAKKATGVVRFDDGGGPGYAMSYRGYYSDLAFDRADEQPAAEFLQLVEGAVGEAFDGYKGGEFVMGLDTPLWRAQYGCTGDAIVSASIVDGDLVLHCKNVDD